MSSHPNGAQPHVPLGAALYVDTENLRDAENARQIVASVVFNWPSDRPPPGSVSLYVRADKAELWRLWAEDAFPGLYVRVRGVQHFSANNSKNSADMAIAADAVSDLVMGRANDVAVVSNDSDFAALFVKVRELAHEAGAETVPFLWITTPDGGTLSPEIAEFIPPVFRWDLSAPPVALVPVAAQPAPNPLLAATRRALPAANADTAISNKAVAEELIRQLPVGRFRAADAQSVIKHRWPDHAQAGTPAVFGKYLLNEVWPLLQQRGATMPSKTSPRTYEITLAVKDSLTPPSQSPSGSVPSGVPSSAQLAAAVAAGITDDLFSASEALEALKVRYPQHPAASYIPQQFGIWFAEELWPIMEQQGVTLAQKKPRRYEMTPDARHRLTSLA